MTDFIFGFLIILIISLNHAHSVQTQQLIGKIIATSEALVIDVTLYYPKKLKIALISCLLVNRLNHSSTSNQVAFWNKKVTLNSNKLIILGDCLILLKIYWSRHTLKLEADSKIIFAFQVPLLSLLLPVVSLSEVIKPRNLLSKVSLKTGRSTTALHSFVFGEFEHSDATGDEWRWSWRTRTGWSGWLWW